MIPSTLLRTAGTLLLVLLGVLNRPPLGASMLQETCRLHPHHLLKIILGTNNKLTQQACTEVGVARPSWGTSSSACAAEPPAVVMASLTSTSSLAWPLEQHVHSRQQQQAIEIWGVIRASPLKEVQTTCILKKRCVRGEDSAPDLCLW